MVKPLRKWHIRFWAILAVVIPAGMVAAVLARPQTASSIVLQPAPSIALPLVLKTISKSAYTASLRASVDTAKLQLQLVNKAVVTSPTLLVYQVGVPSTAATGTDTLLVGRVEATGTYQFALANVSAGAVRVELYDIIHHTLIDTISFTYQPPIKN